MLVHLRFLTVILAAGCSGGKDTGETAPPDPPAGANVTQVAVGKALDFETGNLEAATGGGDLVFDATRNAQAPGQLAVAAAPGGLNDVTVFPTETGAWLGTVAAPDGTGLIVRSDQGWAYAVYVAATAADGSRTLHWRKMTGVYRLLVDLPAGDGSENGYGAVTFAPSGRTCSVARTGGGPVCAEPVAEGSTVTLSAAAKNTNLGYPGCDPDVIRSEFATWTDDAGATPEWLSACAAGSDCAVTLGQDRVVRAGFKKLVTIRLPDPVFDPKGDIEHDMPAAAAAGCDGTSCLYRVRAGTAVTLTARPAEGATFGSWSCPAGGQCQPSLACGGSGGSGGSIMIQTVVNCPGGAATTCTFTAGAALDSRAGTGYEWGGTEWMGGVFN